MDPLSLLKSIVKLDHPDQLKPLNLRSGQVINGKVLRFLPGEMAVIQIGSQKLIARLEASLVANQQYWFEVQSEAGKINLKLLRENTRESSRETRDLPGNPNAGHDGPIEQIYTQVPLQLGQEQAECIIQWNGRRREDGKISPEHCRILFFIELKNLGEIFLDLQFHNRRIRMAIINGLENLEPLAQAQLPFLQESLQKLNFELAGLTIKPPPSEKTLKALIRKTSGNGFDSKHSRGVDIRV